jgi:hypothetical protein
MSISVYRATIERHPSRRINGTITPRFASVAVAAIVLFSFAIQGCSIYKEYFDKTPPNSDIEIDDLGDSGTSAPAPTANVQISYKNKGDSLERVTVVKFFGADAMQQIARDATHQETMVRFGGGVTVWQFKASRSTIGSLTGVGNNQYALKSITYGRVPKDFEQVIPDEGPPEPLDRGSFYVFEVTRASGTTSYQAVKVEGDGSLMAYNAQPRAGSSYLLCCNVDQAFTEPVVLPDASQNVEQAADQMEAPDQGSPDGSNMPPAPEPPPSMGAAEEPDTGDAGTSGPTSSSSGPGLGLPGMMNPSSVPRGDPALAH